MVRGPHSLKFGGEVLHVSPGIRDVSALIGRFIFGGRFSGRTSGASAGYQGGIAYLLLGLPNQFLFDSNTVFNQCHRLYSLFIQDDWTCTHRLTLHYGTRYCIYPAPRWGANPWA